MINKIQSNPNVLINSNTTKSTTDPYKQVAKAMEKEFAQFMISKMRDTVDKHNPDGSELNYYNSLLDSEYADVMTNQNNGLGIQELILNQISPNHKKLGKINMPETKLKGVNP